MLMVAALWRLMWEGVAPPRKAIRWRGRLGRRPAHIELRSIWVPIDRQPAAS